jgi:hypothetical protein
MNRIRSLAAALLCLSGAIHVAQLFAGRPAVDTVITVSFGVIYLVIGVLLFRGGRASLTLGGIIPLVGLLLAIAGMLMDPTLLGAFFIAIDVIVAGCCLYIIARNRQGARM